MTALDRVAVTAGRLKVFPLPSAVLFPHAALPLHIFEPRYRALVSDCLSTDKVMALAQLEPNWEADYQGRPPIKPILCAGVVVWHESLADGRYNILLQGSTRVRLRSELPPTKSYRELEVELIAEPEYHGPEEEALRRAVLELSSRVPAGAADGLLQAAAKLQGGALADIVASSLIDDPERRQELLEELDPRKRLQEVLDDVGEALGRMAPARPAGPMN